MNKYLILSCTTVALLNRDINHAAEFGWAPYGDMGCIKTFHGYEYTQQLRR